MNCPYCAAPGTRMETHRHLLDGHAGEVRTFRDEAKDRLRFALGCPFCDDGMERTVNPRGREGGFLEEFRREIVLVAFDLLLYHLQASHPERIGLPAESTAPSAPTEAATPGGTR
jgi:hypothetical protein